MTRAEVDEWAEQYGDPLLMADGFDDAIVGIGQQFNSFFVVYDYDRCIQVLIDRDGMEWDDAVEFFEVNTLGSFFGEDPTTLPTGQDPRCLCPVFLRTEL